MNAIQFAELLEKLHACPDAVAWAEGKTLTEVWEQCERADWLLWLCARMTGKSGWPSREEIVLTVCDIAETSLHFFEEKYPDNKWPRKAIEAARAWAICNPSEKNKKAYATSAADADATSAAADATSAAASAAAASADASAASADASAASVWQSIRPKKLKEFANVVRKRLNVPNGDKK